MPPQYLILRKNGRVTEVVFYDSDKQTRTVMFSGGRWDARRAFRDIRSQIGWESVPAFCEKKSYRRGVPGRLVEVPNDGKL